MMQHHHLQKLNNTVSLANGSSGVPLVVRRSANSIDDDLLSDNKTSPTSAGNSAIATLVKSIEKHGQSLLHVAKIQEKEKDKERMHQEKEKDKERVHQDRAQLLSHLRK